MPRKQVIVFFPPERASNDLRNACDDARPLWKSLIRASRLPNSVTKANGVVLQKPAFWVGPKQLRPRTQPLPRWGRLAITRLARRLLCRIQSVGVMTRPVRLGRVGAPSVVHRVTMPHCSLMLIL